MLRGRLKDAPGYIESWGTFKGLLDVWRTPEGLEVRGECTDIVELRTWLMPTIAAAHPQADLYIGDIRYPDTELERSRLKLRIRRQLDRNASKMARVVPVRNPTARR